MRQNAKMGRNFAFCGVSVFFVSLPSHCNSLCGRARKKGKTKDLALWGRVFCCYAPSLRFLNVAVSLSPFCRPHGITKAIFVEAANRFCLQGRGCPHGITKGMIIPECWLAGIVGRRKLGEPDPHCITKGMIRPPARYPSGVIRPRTDRQYEPPSPPAGRYFR